MSKYRSHLPQLDGGLFLTDGGLETTLIFHNGLDLPYFASFDLLREQTGRELMRKYYERYGAIATENGMGFVLEAPSWRANPDWGEKLGYSPEALAAANRKSIDLMAEVRDRQETAATPMVISGCLGPRGDGYNPGNIMTEDEAETYHAAQINTFRDTDADMISGLTITNVPEAIGIARAAQAANMPVIISFTLETDGRLPTGQTLKQAIEGVDDATGAGPAYYMINCAHPTHFDTILDTDEAWVGRIRAIRANASQRSHAELDEAEDLDDGDPVKFGVEHRDLRRRHAHINVFGGCCGTDHRHIEQICSQIRATA